jgi:hypothetical protein
MAEAYADVVESAQTAWNARTTAVPLLDVPMRAERPRMAQNMPNRTPPHTTCIDVTPAHRPPMSEWLCGPECPPGRH